jgi:hypothetical protein
LRYLGEPVIGLVVAGVLLTGLVMPYDSMAEAKLLKITAGHDDCAKCPSGGLDKKSDPDRKGHKVVKAPVKKEPPKKDPPKKKEPPKKDPPKKKEPPKKIAPKAPVKKK